jgi:hypothetical protein
MTIAADRLADIVKRLDRAAWMLMDSHVECCVVVSSAADELDDIRREFEAIPTAMEASA